MRMENNADTNFELAEKYFNGKGVEKSYESALEYYKKADEQGHDLAATAIAWMYKFGEGVEKSEETAQYYFKKSQGGIDDEPDERFANFPKIIK